MRKLESVILVGHSSGGAIITAAAEARPAQIGALVYLAAFLLPHGVTPPAIMRDDQNPSSHRRSSLMRNVGQ